MVLDTTHHGRFVNSKTILSDLYSQRCQTTSAFYNAISFTEGAEDLPQMPLSFAYGISSTDEERLFRQVQNFVEAIKVLRLEERLFDFHPIEWRFNCPAKSTLKYTEKIFLGPQMPLATSAKRRSTAFINPQKSPYRGREQIRPVSANEEEKPISPNNFRFGCLNSTQAPCNENDVTCPLKQSRIAQALRDCLWKIWTCLCLPATLCRLKWRQKVSTVPLVTVCDAMDEKSMEVYIAKD
ncbi:unnamed protein product [Ceratitis capitata]|uniref:(Mediterranean fruit fly) hypothetical protein n=1 Tax=Ceratitis capitata TaxID=7213 RepID=A0A811UL49_CERCA|nr:unnamed protein product [Ceratitis capitata]